MLLITCIQKILSSWLKVSLLLRFTNGSVHILRNHFFTDFWHQLPSYYYVNIVWTSSVHLFPQQSILLLFSKNQIFLTIWKNTKRKRFRRTASCLNQNMISRTRNLFTFPDLTFLFQFSYRFFIFPCIIFNFFPQFWSSFKLQLLFMSKDDFNDFNL